MLDILTKAFEQSIKDLDTKKGIVTGYFAAFGNKDSDGDIIEKGAFARTIAENGPKSPKPRIKHLLDHDRTHAVGVLTDLKEDDFGLYYESKAGRHTNGRDFLLMCEDGFITEHSIGYRIEKSTWDGASSASRLQDLTLKEGSSLQCWGANENTPLREVKSAGDLVATLQKLEKALRTGKYSDEAFLEIEKQYKAIGEALKAMKPTPAPNTVKPADLEGIKQLFTLN